MSSNRIRVLNLGAALLSSLLSLACGSNSSDEPSGSSPNAGGAENARAGADMGASAGVSWSHTNSASGGASSSVAITTTLTTTTSCDKFSFFVTSLIAMRRGSGNENGFGGDLGGLTGADELCRQIAETSLSCAGKKIWRAFLSTTSEDAIDRVGGGPWYDRKGRLVANTIADLQQERPASADTAIKNDLPNEDGVPNHSPDGTQVDNHDTLTGSNGQGRLYSAKSTCGDWTSATYTQGKPRLGHSWPGGPSKNWVNAMDAEGCAAGVNLSERMGGGGSCVGCSGGYGGIYCFATTP